MADEVVSHASAADRQAAVTVATLIQNSGMWYVFGAISLIGEILGFILLRVRAMAGRYGATVGGSLYQPRPAHPHRRRRHLVDRHRRDPSPRPRPRHISARAARHNHGGEGA
jgi:hypothetical protein